MCTAFWAGRIIQAIHPELQFEGQAPDRVNQRQRDLVVGRAIGDSLQDTQESLVMAPVLHMPNFELPFVLTMGASAVSVGGTLEQDFGAGLQLVAFESKKLSPAEMRYSAYERELLGIV